MTPIVSPTTTERILRTVGLLAMFGIFSVWFIYDGYIGYPQENLENAAEALDPVPETLPGMQPHVTAEVAKHWVVRTKVERLVESDVTDALGEPGWVSPEEDEMRYFGPSGALIIPFRGDLVQPASFEPAEHTHVDIFTQKLLGFCLLPVALGFVVQLVRVVTTRVELRDDGLKVRGRGVIPFDDMRSLDATRYKKKGWMDLTYSQNGRERVVRLDDYVIRDFRPIITEICNRCGWQNPLPPASNDEAAGDAETRETASSESSG